LCHLCGNHLSVKHRNYMKIKNKSMTTWGGCYKVMCFPSLPQKKFRRPIPTSSDIICKLTTAINCHGSSKTCSYNKYRIKCGWKLPMCSLSPHTTGLDNKQTYWSVNSWWCWVTGAFKKLFLTMQQKVKCITYITCQQFIIIFNSQILFNFSFYNLIYFFLKNFISSYQSHKASRCHHC